MPKTQRRTDYMDGISKTPEQLEQERLVRVAAMEARQQKWRENGELPQRLADLVWDYCWHCEAWYCVCPINGCNSCACGCPHGLANDDDKGCQPWWDLQNMPECTEFEKNWIHPTVKQIVERVDQLNAITQNEFSSFGHDLKCITKYLLLHGIPFELCYDSDKAFTLQITNEELAAQLVAEDEEHPVYSYPTNLAPQRMSE